MSKLSLLEFPSNIMAFCLMFLFRFYLHEIVNISQKFQSTIGFFAESITIHIIKLISPSYGSNFSSEKELYHYQFRILLNPSKYNIDDPCLTFFMINYNNSK